MKNIENNNSNNGDIEQREHKGEHEHDGISRRTLLKAGGAATLATTLLAGGASAQDGSAGPDPYGTDFDALKSLGATRESYWKNNGEYFVQENVDTSQISKNLIRARIDGEWHDFVIRKVDDAFYTFNTNMRKRMMDVMTGSQQFTIYNDAHNAAVGTYGSNRGDSRFTVNVAFKGMGWVPVNRNLNTRIAELEQNYTASMMEKMKLLYDGYADDSMWDLRLQGSLELYTTQSNETHSFLNQMVNPVSTICFLGDESYELRTIARLMHPKDPNLTDYEQKLVKYINFAHDFFHGGPDPSKLIVHNIGVAYWVIEEFDNSPFGATPTAGGKKRVPRF
jgi:hypothetical protein